MPAPAHAAGVTVDRAAEVSGVDADRIRRLAEELAGSSSAVAVPPGIESQGPDAQAAQRAVEELNAVLGASGRAVVADSRTRGVNAGHREMSRLVERMRSGQVGLLVTAGANPAYALPSAMGFADAVAGVARKFAWPRTWTKRPPLRTGYCPPTTRLSPGPMPRSGRATWRWGNR